MSLTHRWTRAAGTLALVAALAATPAEAQAEGPRRPITQVWLDSSGDPLPFQTHEEILEYLRNARVVDRAPIGRGVSGAERLVMDRNGVRLRAAFRTIDETHRGPFTNLPPSYRRIRDAAIFECAAYELSQALGLGRVPPTVWRQIGEAQGSLQIWLEGAMPQDDFLEQSDGPPQVARWLMQKDVMHVFDALIANM